MLATLRMLVEIIEAPDVTCGSDNSYLQSFKGRRGRWESVAQVFAVGPNSWMIFRCYYLLGTGTEWQDDGRAARG